MTQVQPEEAPERARHVQKRDRSDDLASQFLDHGVVQRGERNTRKKMLKINTFE